MSKTCARSGPSRNPVGGVAGPGLTIFILTTVQMVWCCGRSPSCKPKVQAGTLGDAARYTSFIRGERARRGDSAEGRLENGLIQWHGGKPLQPSKQPRIVQSIQRVSTLIREFADIHTLCWYGLTILGADRNPQPQLQRCKVMW